MDNRLDPEKIFEALLNDAEFVAVNTPSTMLVFGWLARELPEVLVHLLDTPLTFGSLMAAKADVARHFLENGYVESLVAAIPDYQIVSVTREDIIANMRCMLSRSIWVFEKMAEDTQGWLKAYGHTDENALENPRCGRLNPEAMAAYRAGTLTVGQLIRIQPSVFMQNNIDS